MKNEHENGVFAFAFVEQMLGSQRKTRGRERRREREGRKCRKEEKKKKKREKKFAHRSPRFEK